jgi:hypothetical protein
MASSRLLVSIAIINLTFGVVLAQPPAGAQNDVKAIAIQINKRNAADAKKLANAAAAKLNVNDIMSLHRPRNKGGMGYGSLAGKNPATDGLEKKIQELAKGVPANILDQVENNVEAANWLAALAELTLVKTPPQDGPNGRTKKAWADWSNALREASIVFGRAAATKNGDDMKRAASTMNSICVNCHSKFK